MNVIHTTHHNERMLTYAACHTINRLRVVDTEIVDLSPLQTSTELIEGMCDKLHGELTQQPPNIKTLQMILQGCVLLRKDIEMLLYFSGSKFLFVLKQR